VWRQVSKNEPVELTGGAAAAAMKKW